ncbi:MAG: HEAT repeat domain-containing protein [Bacteroidales bacterium]
MKIPTTKSILLFLLAIVFSIALMFAFIEIPLWLDALLGKHIGFTGFDHGSNETEGFKAKVYIDALYLRWIGYLCLGLVLIFIILGFTTKKTGWAWAGAFTLFLPVFGQFALSMFFLSGLGILRTAWFPFMDISWMVLDFGKVIYIPYWILMWFCGLFNWYAHDFISWFFMATGAVLFSWGVVAWFQTRFSKQHVATGWIYKFSRHPQYLGWIIWSYGLMLFSSDINNMKKSWGVATSLPWLLMTMIIIAICYLEENKMKEQSNEEYVQYQKNTPFLFPIPKWLKSIIKAPMNLIIKKKQPSNTSEIIKVTGLYTILFIVLSLIWIDFEKSDQSIESNLSKMNLLVTEINQTESRRILGCQFDQLCNFGVKAENELIIFLNDPNPDKREFAAQSLGKFKSQGAIEVLIPLLNDPVYRVSNEAIRALAKIGSPKAIPELRKVLTDPNREHLQGYILQALSDLGDKDIWPLLIERLQSPEWFIRTAALNSLNKLDPDKSLPYVYEALKDEAQQVKRSAVIILLKQKPEGAIDPLSQLYEDNDFETRFYAKQAIEAIKREYPN